MFNVLNFAILFIICSLSANAQDGFDIQTRHRPDPAAAICANEPEDSNGLLARAGDATVGKVLGTRDQCLTKNGLSDSDFTSAADLNRFYDQCTFQQQPQLYSDMGKITEFVHRANRDRLSDALFQDLANRSNRQLFCRIDTISQYHKNPAAKASLDAKATEKFNSVLSRVRELMLSKAAELEAGHEF